LQKRVENTPPMVLQIRFAIWLTLQIEVEALHICKPSHHFASTISAFHVGLRPPGSPHPARFLYARPPSLLRAPALPTVRVRPPAAARARRPSSCRVHPPSSFLMKDPSAAKVSRASSSKVPPWISISLSSIPVAWRPLFVGFWDGRVR